MHAQAMHTQTGVHEPDSSPREYPIAEHSGLLRRHAYLTKVK